MRLSGTRTSSIHQYRGLGDQLWDLGGARPTLDLNFAHNKSLVDSTTGQSLVTFTRASVGTYVDSAGVLQTATTNVPRFDHDPTTGESLGLLIEEARTNLMTRSVEFNDASWAKTASTVTADSITAPDGTTSADLLLDNTSNAAHFISQSATYSVTPYTLSVYMKQQKSGYYGFLRFGAGSIWTSTTGIIVNLSNGALIASSGVTSYYITAVGNGWYRVSIVSTPNSAGTGTPAQIGVTTQTSVGSVLYTGDGASGVYIWGAQIEAGSFPTSYIPTTSATVTRSADVASITGSNFSSWYNQSGGTTFAEYRTPASGTRGVAGYNDATANERLALYTSGTDPKFTTVDGGVTQADLDGGTITASTMTKTAAAYAANDFSIVHAGGAAVTDVSGTLPTVTQLLVGADQAGNYQCGRIKRLTYWPTRLSDTTLQKITQ